MEKLIYLIAGAAMISFVLLLSNTITGQGWTGFDRGDPAVIAYAGYPPRMPQPNLCMAFGEYKEPRTYADALEQGLNMRDDCTYSYHQTGWPGYCCKR